MNKKITYIFLYCCFFVNILFFYNSGASDDFMNCDGCSSNLEDIFGPGFSEEELHKQLFQRTAYCKITPNIKVLLSIPQDRDFEKKYTTEHEEILRKQCNEGVLMDVYLQNDTGIFKTMTRTHSTFPACVTLPMMYGWGGMDVEIERYFLVPGSFFSTPLVFDKNFEIIKGNFALTDDYVLPGEEHYPESLPPPSPRIGNIPDRTYLSKPKVRTKFENVSHLPECTPNLRFKK